MIKLNKIQSILASSKDELKRKYRVKELGIFGSYARGELKDSILRELKII